MKKHIFSIVYLLLGVAAGALAQHWTVNPRAFQYDMTAYVQLDVADQSACEVAAFCMGECRGTGKLLTAADGSQLFQLRIRSNVITGEHISFCVYRKSVGEELWADADVTFEAQTVVGTPSEPLILSIAALLRGDANGDGTIDVNDVTAIVNRIQGVPSPSFVESAADVNGDGTIDVNDITGVVNIIQGQ